MDYFWFLTGMELRDPRSMFPVIVRSTEGRIPVRKEDGQNVDVCVDESREGHVLWVIEGWRTSQVGYEESDRHF